MLFRSTQLAVQEFHLRLGRIQTVFKGDAHLFSVCAQSPVFTRARRKLNVVVPKTKSSRRSAGESPYIPMPEGRGFTEILVSCLTLVGTIWL